MPGPRAQYPPGDGFGAPQRGRSRQHLRLGDEPLHGLSGRDLEMDDDVSSPGARQWMVMTASPTILSRVGNEEAPKLAEVGGN